MRRLFLRTIKSGKILPDGGQISPGGDRFRPVATKGSAFGIRKPLKRLDRNFNNFAERVVFRPFCFLRLVSGIGVVLLSRNNTILLSFGGPAFPRTPLRAPQAPLALPFGQRLAAAKPPRAKNRTAPPNRGCTKIFLFRLLCKNQQPLRKSIAFLYFSCYNKLNSYFYAYNKTNKKERLQQLWQR